MPIKNKLEKISQEEIKRNIELGLVKRNHSHIHVYTKMNDSKEKINYHKLSKAQKNLVLMINLEENNRRLLFNELEENLGNGNGKQRITGIKYRINDQEHNYVDNPLRDMKDRYPKPL